MQKTRNLKQTVVTLVLLLFSVFFYGQADNPPSISATGNQAFCAGSPINIVTDFSITDPDDNAIDAFYIQISVGYQRGFDLLRLEGIHPTILTNWDDEQGKLSLFSSTSTVILLSDLEKAVKDVVYLTNATTIVAEKNFSLSIGDANYLPETDHFYQFISDDRITWSDAKIAAENRFYYGRQGYLATLTSEVEADFAGKQASGAGWIGATDAENEGEWKWVTGPEAGTVFWRGTANGTAVAYAKWNSNEPNDLNNNEDYAHITDPSIGIVGSWNDLPNIGGDNLYTPKGYIVEYGAPGDPPLSIVATTRIYIPQIEIITDAIICESGIATISVTASEGEVLWFDDPDAGNLVETGTTFTTPFLTNTTSYYATASVNGCTTLPRTPVTITVNPRPTIANTTDDLICSGSATLTATASDGDVFWYDSMTSTTPIFIGETFQTPVLTSSVTYYVIANRDSCESATRTPIHAILDETIPQFDLLQNKFVLCSNMGTVTLETVNPRANYTYIWKKEKLLISGNSSSISVTSAGNYSVSAISEAGCISDEKTILVTNSEIANITKDDVIITDDSTNNSIQIANPNLGIGDYEFAIDDEFGVYVDKGFFQNLSPGIHTLFVRDQLGCGISSFRFSILAYPKFFSPNGDGQNDFWTIKGFDTAFYTISNINIYNRFGKLIYTIENNSVGWNGNYQGKKLPSNTYWFRAYLTDINGFLIEKTGNFSLLRE